MAAVVPGAIPRRDTIWQRLRLASMRAELSNPLIGPPLALPTAWAAATAYVEGNVVSNGGNLYECHAAGISAGSGGPTGTGPEAITDGTASWVHAGAPLASTASPLVPTITHFNGDAPTGLDNRYLAGTTLTEDVVRVVGGWVEPLYGGWMFPSTSLFTTQTGNVRTGEPGLPGLSAGMAGIEFITDAPKVAFLWGYPQPFRLFIDRVQVWPGTQRGGTGGGVCGPVIDYTGAGGRKDRLWRLEFGNGPVHFTGICVDAASAISYPHASDTIRFIVLGDSLAGQASGFPASAPDLWVNQLGKRMGWDDNRSSSIGGTGYTTGGAGPSPKPIDRIGDMTDHAPIIGAFAFGTNDVSSGASAITAAALATFQAARAELPGVPLFVWGIPVAQLQLSDAVLAESAVFAAVTQAMDPLLIPIPVSTDPDPWFNADNTSVYISPDGVHGTQAWHARFAARSAIAIRKIIAARA